MTDKIKDSGGIASSIEASLNGVLTQYLEEEIDANTYKTMVEGLQIHTEILINIRQHEFKLFQEEN